jgi:hypothetical protein
VPQNTPQDKPHANSLNACEWDLMDPENGETATERYFTVKTPLDVRIVLLTGLVAACLILGGCATMGKCFEATGNAFNSAGGAVRGLGN